MKKNSIKERAKRIPKETKDKVKKDMLMLYADACMNEYLVGLLCTKTIPMPNPDSNSISESIIKYLKSKETPSGYWNKNGEYIKNK